MAYHSEFKTCSKNIVLYTMVYIIYNSITYNVYSSKNYILINLF